MHDLTTGPIRGHLLRMSAFMLMSMVVQTLYSLIDLYWVGRLGSQAVAAVSLAGNLMMAVLALTQVLSVGTAAMIAQAAGRKDRESVQRLFNQSQLLTLVLGGSFALVLFALRGVYARALAGDAETARLAKDFLTWFAPAIFLQFPMATLGSALRGVGDVRTASLAQIGSVLLNIVLAPFLIFGWGTGLALGVSGAALATLIAVAAGSGGLLLQVLRKGHHFDLRRAAWRAQPRLWWQIARIGLPSGAEFALMALYFGFIMALLRPFGAGHQAAFGIGMRVLQAGMIPALAVWFSGAAIVGQNFGARRPARVRESFRECLMAGLLGVAPFVLLFHLAPRALLSPFSGDPEVLGAGEEFLRIISWNLVTMGVGVACGAVFAGFGNTLPSLISAGLRVLLIVAPAWWLSRRADFVPRWLWELSAAANALQLLLNLWFVRREMAVRLRPLQAASPPAPVATVQQATQSSLD
jgi:putative MATE family efflux protein